MTIGAWLNDELQSSLTEWLIGLAQVSPAPLKAPPGVEIARRFAADGRAVTFVLNHNRQEAQVPLPSPQKDVLSGETFSGSLPLPPYGVRVLTSPPNPLS